MAGAVSLLVACAPKGEYEVLRQQNLEMLTRIDELTLEARRRDRTIDEYRGALASATTLLKDLRQQLDDAQNDKKDVEKKLDELSQRWDADRQRILAYEAQLSQARADLNEVRHRLSGLAGKAASPAASRPSDETQEKSAAP